MTRERRATRRIHFRGGVLPPAARVHPGREVIVVDLSRHGALVEGLWRLRPGARIDLQLETGAKDTIVRGRVERCYVASLTDPAGVRYRAAIRFETAVDYTPPGDLLAGYSVPIAAAAGKGVFGQGLPAPAGGASAGRSAPRKRS